MIILFIFEKYIYYILLRRCTIMECGAYKNYSPSPVLQRQSFRFLQTNVATMNDEEASNELASFEIQVTQESITKADLGKMI